MGWYLFDFLMWFLKPESENVDIASWDEYHRKVVFSIVSAYNCPDLLTFLNYRYYFSIIGPSERAISGCYCWF